MQYYERRAPISNPIEVSSTIIMYGKAGGTYRQDKTTYAGTWAKSEGGLCARGMG